MGDNIKCFSSYALMHVFMDMQPVTFNFQPVTFKLSTKNKYTYFVQFVFSFLVVTTFRFNERLSS